MVYKPEKGKFKLLGGSRSRQASLVEQDKDNRPSKMPKPNFINKINQKQDDDTSANQLTEQEDRNTKPILYSQLQSPQAEPLSGVASLPPRKWAAVTPKNDYRGIEFGL